MTDPLAGLTAKERAARLRYAADDSRRVIALDRALVRLMRDLERAIEAFTRTSDRQGRHE